MSLQKILADTEVWKSGTWLFIERVFFLLKGFGLSLLFANLLPKETFGAYQYIFSLIGTACVFALPGMGTAIVQAVARKYTGTFRKAVALMFQYSLYGILFLLLAALISFFQGQKTVALLLVTLPLFPFYAVVTGAWRAYYTGQEKFVQAAKIGMGGEAFLLVALGTTLYLSPRLEYLIILSLFVPTVYYGYFLFISLQASKHDPIDESNLIFGKKLSWLYGAGVVASYFDKIVIGHFLGFVELAVYAIATMIPDQIRDSVRVIVGYVLPGFSRMDDTRDNQRLILKGIGLLFILVLVAVFAYILIAPFFFHWFFPAYKEALPYTRVAALVSLTVPFMILDSYFRAHKDDTTTTRVALSGYVAGTLGGLMLIPFFGLWGALAARGLSLFVNALLFLIAFLKRGPRMGEKSN